MASNAGRLGALVAKYGRVAVGVHLCTSAMWYGAIYSGVKNGLDVNAILGSVGLPTPSEKFVHVGDMAFAYAGYKCLTPVRWPVTIALTPIVKKKLDA